MVGHCKTEICWKRFSNYVFSLIMYAIMTGQNIASYFKLQKVHVNHSTIEVTEY